MNCAQARFLLYAYLDREHLRRRGRGPLPASRGVRLLRRPGPFGARASASSSGPALTGTPGADPAARAPPRRAIRAAPAAPLPAAAAGRRRPVPAPSPRRRRQAASRGRRPRLPSLRRARSPSPASHPASCPSRDRHDRAPSSASQCEAQSRSGALPAARVPSTSSASAPTTARRLASDVDDPAFAQRLGRPDRHRRRRRRSRESGFLRASRVGY